MRISSSARRGAFFRANRGWGVLFALGCFDPFHTQFDAIEPAVRYQSSQQVEANATPTSLRVMTYNLKFGGGRLDFFFDCHGTRVLMSRSEVLGHLEALAEKVRQVDPDVLFVQEVEVNSKRAAFVDELQWMLDHTDLNHARYASQWKADFVPSDGLGAVDSGNAILSKYPLGAGTRIALALRKEQSAIERYFFVQRNLLRSELLLPSGDSLWLANLHAAAYSQDGTKKLHIDRFKQELDALSELGTVVGGGDLNALPPDSNKTEDFDDSVCTNEEYLADDYTEENDWLRPLYDNYTPAIALEEYRADNDRFFTHTTSSTGFWNRKLDYLFTNGEFEPESAQTHQDLSSGGSTTMPLSDHAPLSVTLELQ